MRATDCRFWATIRGFDAVSDDMKRNFQRHGGPLWRAQRRLPHEGNDLAQPQLRHLAQDADDPSGNAGCRGDVEVVEYLKTPPSRDTLAQLYKDAGISPRDGLRTRGSPAEELGLLDADGDTILDAMAKEPILIERPLVRTDKGVRLCRPQDLVRDIL